MLGLGLGLNRFNLAALSKTRYFSTFDPVLNTYGELDTAFRPSGDFEVEAQVSTVSSSGFNTIFSGTNQAENTIVVDVNSSTGQVRFLAYVGTTAQSIITSSATVNDGQIHAIKATYTGNTAELFVGGISQGSATWALDGNQDIKTVGFRPVLLNYFDGIIANVRLTDLATPANSRFFPVGLSGTATVENSTINSGSITYYNLPEANCERFTFDEPNGRWVGSVDLWTLGQLSLVDGASSSSIGVDVQLYQVVKHVDSEVTKQGGSWVGLGSETIYDTLQFPAFRNPSGGNIDTIVFTPTIKRVLELA